MTGEGAFAKVSFRARGVVMATTDDLPESYKALRERDEAFWVEQERNIQGALGQPCCTLSGISSSLLAMRGHFALVIHGEDECAGCFRHMGPSTMQLFCTGLTEQEFVSGRTSEPLKRCLRLVCTEIEPEAVFILGTCPVEVIGDRFETTVAQMQEEFPEIPMRALHTSGLKVGTQTAMLDWFFETLASLPTREPVDDQWKREVGVKAMMVATSALSPWARGLDEDVEQMLASPRRPRLERESTLAFVGLPRTRRMRTGRPEYVDVLGTAGLRVIANYPSGASLDDWRAIKFPKASFVADRSLYPRLVGILEESGQEVVEVPLPVGVGQTDRVYEAIGRVMGREDAEIGRASCRERV